MQEWLKFDQEEIEKVHGHIYFYRALYDGDHSEIFQRAKDLINKGEIVDNIMNGSMGTPNVQTPYIVANVTKLIAEIPATLVSRSIGDMNTNLSNEDEESEDQETKQQDIIDEIQKNSNLKFEHWGNVLQHQIDGGIVGVPRIDEDGISLEFKSRDVYYPHGDGKGVDLAYNISYKNYEYLHVYRERVEAGNLVTQNLLFSLDGSKQATPLDEDTTKEILGMDELAKTYEGRKQPFIIYWPNGKTFMHPLGVSDLKNQEGKQDEINWTLTRSAITFERNGKPRIAVSQAIMDALQNKAEDRYGDENKIDHRDLEITTIDEQGNSMEVIQIDTSKIGDIGWVKDLTKMMLMETQTSEKAVDFYLDGSGGSNPSGIAKFYDLFTSILKSESIQSQYIYFLKHLMESALWLAQADDPSIEIEEPEVQINEMIPISRKELYDQNASAHDAEVQSLETTIRRNNPTASEEWIQEELERVESEKADDDSMSMQNGRQSLQQFMNNRDSQGNPLDSSGNPMPGSNG